MLLFRGELLIENMRSPLATAVCRFRRRAEEAFGHRDHGLDLERELSNIQDTPLPGRVFLFLSFSRAGDFSAQGSKVGTAAVRQAI